MLPMAGFRGYAFGQHRYRHDRGKVPDRHLILVPGRGQAIAYTVKYDCFHFSTTHKGFFLSLHKVIIDSDSGRVPVRHLTIAPTLFVRLFLTIHAHMQHP